MHDTVKHVITVRRDARGLWRAECPALEDIGAIDAVGAAFPTLRSALWFLGERIDSHHDVGATHASPSEEPPNA